MQTTHLDLIPGTRSASIAMVDAMSPADRAQLSADWIARLAASGGAKSFATETMRFPLPWRDQS